MDKTVIISIRSVVQSVDNEPPESTELITEGRLTDCGEAGYTLSYQESEITGLEGTLTTFHVEPDCITLMRVGQFNSQMVFQPGRRHFSFYGTPYGTMSIGVNTRRMRSNLTADGGQIEIDYAVEIDHALVGKHVFRIDVRERPTPLRQ